MAWYSCCWERLYHKPFWLNKLVIGVEKLKPFLDTLTCMNFYKITPTYQKTKSWTWKQIGKWIDFLRIFKLWNWLNIVFRLKTSMEVPQSVSGWFHVLCGCLQILEQPQWSSTKYDYCHLYRLVLLNNFFLLFMLL